MPAGHSQRIHPQDSQHLVANSKATHIRNKDGTKLITVPSRKVSNPESTSAALSPPPPPPPMDYSNGANPNSTGGKKKKKKRGKQPQQQQKHCGTPAGDDVEDYGYEDDDDDAYNPVVPLPRPSDAHYYQQDIRDSMAGFDDCDAPELGDPEDEDDLYSDQENVYDDEESYSPQHNAPALVAGKNKKNKKKKKKLGTSVADNTGGTGLVQTRKPKDRIWNTSTSEERERIKDFWLSLGEEERRSLVKVEKEAVLRKMKEQQKHSCSCSVCGRKRTAIEEELEVLYDAYYEELEQYANQQQTNKYLGNASPIPQGSYSNRIIPPPPPPSGPPPNSLYENHHNHHDHRSIDLLEGEFEGDENEEYEEEDEVLDHPLSPPPQSDSRSDFFNFGNSLTVQGGILTVADDLLKNDGKKFIEMMEQLAERRMAREEEANSSNGGPQRDANLHHQHVHGHTQPELDDEEDYDEDEEEGEYDDEEEEDEEPDTMTEEQRMEEGRRMFQIFAARMFEQRVLTAYREKVARERQRKLLEELEEEERRKEEREEKKAKDKDKKKEKKRQQRQAKEEERLKREAEKREEEEKQKAIEMRKVEEQRRRKEEQRQKREAERKAAEEEKQRKDEEKRKRLQEEREREAERERKRRETQERERKKKDEAAKKAKDEREAKGKEVRERREREERERKEREAKSRKEAAERERKRREDEARAKAEAVAVAKRVQPSPKPPTIPQSQPAPPQLSLLPQPLQLPLQISGYGAPHLPVAPAIPKPSGTQTQGSYPRNPSQQGSLQGSQGSSPKTPCVAPRLGSSASPSTPVLQQTAPGPIQVKGFHFPAFAPTSPIPPHIAPPPGVPPSEGLFPGISPIGINGPSPMQPFLPSISQRPPMGTGIPIFTPPGQVPPLGPSSQYRGFSASANGMPMQIPVAPGIRQIGSQGRGVFMGDMPHQLPPGVPLPSPGSPFVNRVEPIPISGHSRIPSGSFEQIHRPAPIQRPASVAPHRNGEDRHHGVDELSKVMGSRALLEDDDEPLPENISPTRRVSGPQFAPRPIRGSIAASPLFGDSFGGLNDFGASWSNPLPLGSSSFSGSLPTTWTNKAGWTDIDAGAFNRRRTTRIDHIRILACQKFRELSGPGNQPVEISTLQRAVQTVAPAELQFAQNELTHILDVEGDPQNGSGSFDQRHENGRILVHYSSDEFADFNHGPVRAGEIGSPSAAGAMPFRSPLGPPGMATSPTGY